MSEPNQSDLLVQLSDVFGAHKAEWLGPRIFDLFTEPNYFPRLTTARPCFLIGGRGTGKTTVLRSLSYQGQFALSHHDPAVISQSPFYGLYYRVDTNRVTAFKGHELDETNWSIRFGHYINLIFVVQLMRFLGWYNDTTGIETELSEAALDTVASSLHLAVPLNNTAWLGFVQRALTEFEAHINNVATSPGPLLSLQTGPVVALLEGIGELSSFHDKLFFFLIDEYENLEDYQQRVMNTFIKHSGPRHSFKVSVKELGWRVRTTLNENEQLISPADYVRIDISEALAGAPFEEFAHRVSHDRLSMLPGTATLGMRELFPSISQVDEATQLGIEQHNDVIRQALRAVDSAEELENLDPLQIYLIKYWADGQRIPLESAFEDFVRNRPLWDTRLNNYGHSILFTLRKGRRGIRKYYAGWDTFIQLADGNLRFLLQLVEESLAAQIREEGRLDLVVSSQTQTLAAQRIGRANLTELEGLAVRGARLTKLLLGLGRIFGVMAAQPEGHAPEVNQFTIAEAGLSELDTPEAHELLNAAIMHLALVRSSGNKLQDPGETSDWDYMIHPIYAPFFAFSHRRKRKMRIRASDLDALVSNPKQTIRRILTQHKRTEEEPLPEQLGLFETYYADPA